jgi:hypothetical protein
MDRGIFDMRNEIAATALTTFEVAPDGSWVRLNVLTHTGEPAALTLPAACVNQLLMTIPRMVDIALRNSHGDNSLRFVHPIQSFAFELAGPDCDDDPHLILTIETDGGFKASFGACARVMMQLGHSIVDGIARSPCANLSALLS